MFMRSLSQTPLVIGLHWITVSPPPSNDCGEAGQGEVPLPPLSLPQAASQWAQIEAVLFAAQA